MSTALLCDLYELTMAQAYWKQGMAERRALFQLNFRTCPFEGGYAVAAGLDVALQTLEQLRFDKEDLCYLGSLESPSGGPLFEAEFLKFMGQFVFRCDLDAVAEGTVVFPQQPLLRVEGPLLQAQLVESLLLNLINFSTLIATKSSRICQTAAPKPVVEFGLRRAQGPNGALLASRSAFIGGATSSSHALAGQLLGIPLRGTHAHSWVMAFDEEMEALRSFAICFPDHPILLVDTYETIAGVERVIQVAKELAPSGFVLGGIRLDSGDLAALSQKARQLLDRAGFTEAKIMATGDLDEHRIASLREVGAPIDLWGVGTHLVTAKDQPALDGIYKLTGVQDRKGRWQARMKLSSDPAKSTYPGKLQVRRFLKPEGLLIRDVIFDEWSGCEADGDWTIDLLEPVMREGRRMAAAPTLSFMQNRAKEQIASLPLEVRKLKGAAAYPVVLDKRLQRAQDELANLLKREVK